MCSLLINACTSHTNGINFRSYLLLGMVDMLCLEHVFQLMNSLVKIFLDSGRNMQQSNLSLPGSVSGSDRGVRMVPNRNGVGMTCGISRSMSLSRPGLRGMASSTMLNSGCMLSNLVGMPSPVNMHSGPGSGHGNSMLRPRDTMHMMRVSNLLFKEQYD